MSDLQIICTNTFTYYIRMQKKKHYNTNLTNMKLTAIRCDTWHARGAVPKEQEGKILV